MIAYATKNRAVQAVKTGAGAVFGLIFSVSVLVAVLAGCSALPDKPVRPVLYDFGPGAVAPPTITPEAPLPAVGLEDITTVGGALDNTALLYRLAYTNEQQLRPYAEARWTTPPAQLVRQRLREKLSERRPVFGARDGLALSRPALPPVAGQPKPPSDGALDPLPLRRGQSHTTPGARACQAAPNNPPARQQTLRRKKSSQPLHWSLFLLL